MDTQLDSLSYSFGVSFGHNLKQSNFEGLNIEAMAQGLRDVYSGDGEVTMTREEAEQNIQQHFMKVQEEQRAAKSGEAKKFLENNAKEANVQVLPSGLQYIVLKEGSGDVPKITDRVTTHYHGTLVDGTVFDSSYERGEPATFAVNQVIPGWTEALQLMTVGSKWKLFIPSELAYGDRGAGNIIGPGETLIFDVELLAIEPAEQP